MSTTLAERAAALAGHSAAAPPAAEPRAAAPALPMPLPEVNIPEPPPEGPDQVPVWVAWSRVMGEVRGIGKNSRVTEGPAKFAYRGVDDALNVFGPACRLHGVLVLPVGVEASYRDTKTSTGKPTRECTVVVSYRIYGPSGDFIEVQAAGESLDTQDKGTAKAQAVALRTLLMHGGLVPTGDPDPDSKSVERGEAQVRPPASYRDEILHAGTTRQRMAQIRNELRQLRMWSATVANELGQDEPLVELLDRVGRERFAPKPQQAPDADEPADATAGHWRDPETGEEIPNNVGVQPGEFGGES